MKIGDPGPLLEVHLVEVRRDGVWRPYDWRSTNSSALALAGRLRFDGQETRVRVNQVPARKYSP